MLYCLKVVWLEIFDPRFFSWIIFPRPQSNLWAHLKSLSENYMRRYLQLCVYRRCQRHWRQIIVCVVVTNDKLSAVSLSIVIEHCSGFSSIPWHWLRKKIPSCLLSFYTVSSSKKQTSLKRILKKLTGFQICYLIRLLLIWRTFFELIKVWYIVILI